VGSRSTCPPPSPAEVRRLPQSALSTSSAPQPDSRRPGIVRPRSAVAPAPPSGTTSSDTPGGAWPASISRGCPLSNTAPIRPVVQHTAERLTVARARKDDPACPAVTRLEQSAHYARVPLRPDTRLASLPGTP
jgi:hypothetical protein